MRQQPAAKQARINWGDAFRQDMPVGKTARGHSQDGLDVDMLGVQSFDHLEKLLRDVRLTGDRSVKVYEHATIQPRKYKLGDLSPLALYTLQSQLTQQKNTFHHLGKHYGQNLFGLTGILDYKQDGGTYRMAPPIIERFIEPTTGKEVAVIIDGLHRLSVARQLGFEEIWVIEISDIPASLPPQPLPLSWDEIQVYDEVPPNHSKKRHRYSSPADYPDMKSVTAVPITQDNYLYFLYRDYSSLGSGGIRGAYVSKYEAPILEEFKKISMGASHATEHVLEVLGFAKQLGQAHGADVDSLTASVLLHDLGRNNTKLQGPASAQESTVQAKPILRTVGFPKDKIDQVLQNIAEHDQPALRPAFLEGRILKDADFLGGLGATGIMRSALWTGESGGSIEDFIYRIEVKMRQRVESLEFPESRQYAQERYIFARLFLDKLRNDTATLPKQQAEYIVIEGISGSGKTSQVELLRNHYASLGKSVVCVQEPTKFYATLKQQLKIVKKDSETKMLLLLLDRYTQVSPKIKDALAASKTVIADRSYITTLVYQAEDEWLSPANIAYIHSIVAQPSRIIILDVEPEVALKRILRRAAQEGKPVTENENLEQLRTYRERYKRLPEILPHVVLLPVDKLSETQVHAKIKKILKI